MDAMEILIVVALLVFILCLTVAECIALTHGINGHALAIFFATTGGSIGYLVSMWRAKRRERKEKK